jgi:Ca2+-binding EF-hand superfamily protein
MACPAAAIVGVRLGKERARKELRIGRDRQRIVDDAAFKAQSFEAMFNRQPPGTSEQRLRSALGNYGGKHKTLTADDFDFIYQAADVDKNGVLDPEEVMFAFRMYCVWADHHEKFQGTFRKHDVDGSGSLNRIEFHNFLVELNEGQLVKNDEVEWVMKRADVNQDGKLHLVELIVAVSVWYCDVPVLRERRPSCLAVQDILCLLFLSRETRYTQRHQRMKDTPALKGVQVH